GSPGRCSSAFRPARWWWFTAVAWAGIPQQRLPARYFRLPGFSVGPASNTHTNTAELSRIRAATHPVTRQAPAARQARAAPPSASVEDGSWRAPSLRDGHQGGEQFFHIFSFIQFMDAGNDVIQSDLLVYKHDAAAEST